MTTAATPTAVARGSHHRMLVAALLLTGLSMRTAVTSVGAALDDLQRGLHASGTVAGLITTLPVVCFAGIGALTPRLSRHLGAHRLLTGSLVVTTVGLLLRPEMGNSAGFAALSVLALAAGAVSNVLMPTLVKLHFPERIGPMTALYTTALAVGVTAGAGLTVPIGDAVGGWRVGLGSWGLLTAVAVLPWLPTLRRDPAEAGAAHAVPMSAMLHSRTAWAVMIFFAAQSMQAYIAFGWFARFLVGHGISHATAGAMVAALSAVGIPVSLVAPRVPAERQRAVITAFCGCNLIAYVGMALAPVGGAWVWMVLAGIGGGTFPIALTIIGLRARDAGTTASLSAFSQSLGYIIAGSGPLLFGALFGATGSWALPLAVLFGSLVITQVAAWPATAPRFVDDEMRMS
ncbi:MAG TPA: MFS transporter [Jatrophihabitans sp.]|uniref:CynX/NimT family MFS transporter n=1 Tax=Jatrophihabitans sp. TaxID=1932789 RepID=UPI002E05C3EE|nr:MFS transporter [Jatrophihabitans sp.]